MCTDKNPAVMKIAELLVRDDYQPLFFEPVNLPAVVNDVTQAIQDGILAEFAFSNFDGMNHAKAKSGVGINGNLQPYCFLTNS